MQALHANITRLMALAYPKDDSPLNRRIGKADAPSGRPYGRPGCCLQAQDIGEMDYKLNVLNRVDVGISGEEESVLGWREAEDAVHWKMCTEHFGIRSGSHQTPGAPPSL